MDPFRKPETSIKAKKSTSSKGQATTVQSRQNISQDDTRESRLVAPSIGGSSSKKSFLSRERPSLGVRQLGGTYPQMSKKTMTTKLVSPPASAHTPRVRFLQHKSPSTLRPPHLPGRIIPSAARKAASSTPFRNKQPAMPSNQPTPYSMKTARLVLPLWQQLDEEHELVYKRKRNVRRISTPLSREIPGQNQNHKRVKASIAPKLKLRMDGEMDLSSSEDEPDLRPRPRLQSKVPLKTTGGRQVAAKKSSARKIEFENASSEGSETGSLMDTDSQEDQLLPEEYELPSNHEREAPFRHATVFNPAPQITIALPQVKTEPEDDFPLGELDPSEELISAVEALTINPIRMQATRHLPFLRRNLRRGFISRCADVLIPIHPDQKCVSLEVVYDHLDGIVFKAKIEDWLCPLCNLFGKFTTQATLFCHLKWDHQEIVCEWVKIEESDALHRWKLQVMIPQDIRGGRAGHLGHENETDDEQEEGEEEEEEAEEAEEAEIPDVDIPRPTSPFSTPFPSVTMSPLSAPQEPQEPQTKTETTTSPTPKLSRETPEPLTSRFVSITQPPSSRSRSTTGMSRTTRTASTAATPRVRDTRYPTPPPPDDPLGPAARPPYFPAYSEYGGPTLYYSCRPGGPCLFDLIGTLPMKEFGILDWQVIDREEEIYESDDVKDEYKIMHVLWARWITVHRNEFISNYYLGTLAFVDYFWRMIHRAAGWDGLRYWLLILLANQFLNPHEVAQVLIHYEGLTGMETLGCPS